MRTGIVKIVHSGVSEKDLVMVHDFATTAKVRRAISIPHYFPLFCWLVFYSSAQLDRLRPGWWSRTSVHCRLLQMSCRPTVLSQLSCRFIGVYDQALAQGTRDLARFLLLPRSDQASGYIECEQCGSRKCPVSSQHSTVCEVSFMDTYVPAGGAAQTCSLSSHSSLISTSLSTGA